MALALKLHFKIHALCLISEINSGVRPPSHKAPMVSLLKSNLILAGSNLNNAMLHILSFFFLFYLPMTHGGRFHKTAKQDT